MGKSNQKNANYRKAKNATDDQKRNQSEIINFVISIVSLFIGILSGFFDIVDKPPINFGWIASLLLIFSSVTGLVFSYHKYTKTATAKKKIVQYGVYLFWGLLFILGIFLLITKSNPNVVNQENAPQQLENDKQQLLMQAELYYNGEKYESMIELYSSEALRENPIVLNNLGYMYSKGIYFEQNLDMAIQYYENASEKGLDDALHNLVSLKLHNCKTFQEAVDVLRTGYDSNERGTFLFLGSILESKDLSETEMTDQEQNILKAKIESFFDADNETQSEILSASLGPWEYKTTISDTVSHGDGNEFERYTLYSSRYVNSPCGLPYIVKRTYTYVYGISTRTFVYNNLMQECFVSVTDSEQIPS